MRMQQLWNPYKQGRQCSSLQASLFEILIELVPVSADERIPIMEDASSSFSPLPKSPFDSIPTFLQGECRSPQEDRLFCRWAQE